MEGLRYFVIAVVIVYGCTWGTHWIGVYLFEYRYSNMSFTQFRAVLCHLESKDSTPYIYKIDVSLGIFEPRVHAVVIHFGPINYIAYLCWLTYSKLTAGNNIVKDLNKNKVDPKDILSK